MTDGLDEQQTEKETRARSFIAEAFDDLRAVADVVDDARASVPGWDNLAFLRAFARAATRAQPTLSTTTNPLSRRLIAQTLLRLVPPALLPPPWPLAALSGASALALPASVLSRADDGFALRASDAPDLHPSWSAFLARPGLMAGVLARGHHEHLLCPRSLSPGAEPRGSAVLVRVDECSGDAATVRVLASDGTSSSRRLTSDGKDAGVAAVKLEVLQSWLENAGPGARALDLRKAADRCLWLAFQAVLSERRLDGLLRKELDPGRRADVVEAVVDAAADTVAAACLDPLSCRFVLPPASSSSWSAEAADILTATGLVVEVQPRTAAATASEARDRAGGGSADRARHFVWLDAVADSGFVGGAVSVVAQARAFGRLAVSFLAPLGALPTVGARDGRGVVVVVVGEDKDGAPRQRGPYWVEPSWPASPVTPLLQAWQEGRGQHLPEPRGAFAHDVAALPQWLGHFRDAMTADAKTSETSAETSAETSDETSSEIWRAAR